MRLAGCAQSWSRRWVMLSLEPALSDCVAGWPLPVPAIPSQGVAVQMMMTRGTTSSLARFRDAGSGRSITATPPWFPRTPRSQQTLRVSPAALSARSSCGVCCIGRGACSRCADDTALRRLNSRAHAERCCVPAEAPRGEGQRWWQAFNARYHPTAQTPEEGRVTTGGSQEAVLRR